ACLLCADPCAPACTPRSNRSRLNKSRVISITYTREGPSRRRPCRNSLESNPMSERPGQPLQASVSREEFRKDSEKVVARAIRDGRVVIRDEQGRAVAAISAPTDQRPVHFE